MSRIRIKTIHIKNYRSIKDSKKIEIKEKVSVFAGKNESGKTNILKAIQAFYDDKFEEDDIPVDDKSSNPEIKINFEMSKEYLSEKLNRKIDGNIDYFTLGITRSKDVIDKFEGSVLDVFNEIFLDKFNSNEEYKGYINKDESKKLIIDIVNDKKENAQTIINEKIEDIKEENDRKKLLDYISKILDEMQLHKTLKNLIPQIAYFDSFEDMLPDELTKEEIKSEDFEKKNKAFINLLYMLGIKKEEFMKKIEGDERNQSSEFKKISKEITRKYNSVYLQEKVSIGLDKNGDKIFIQIFDEGDLDNDKKPSQRSKGFQWFIAFYLLLNSLNKDAIILIDEPGLYLHAKAQEDILRFLNDEVNNTILFTTHSPYLIDINKLDSLNLVRKDNEHGTMIDQKYYNCKDQDTITPLITAIGYNVAKNPIEIGKGLNIITEGISDRFYLLAFLKLMGIQSDINIIPSTGSGNVHILVSLAIGWNLDYLILLDNDTGKDSAIEKIRNLYVSEEEMNKKIIYPVEKGAIEEIFSKEDKKKFNISKNRKVISSYSLYKKVMNDKILVGDFSEQTRENIKNLLSKFGLKQ